MRQTGIVSRATFALVGVAVWALVTLLSLTPLASAAPPSHLRDKARDVNGLNHACGVAVDSEGDLYASSAGESKIKVFDSSHSLLTSIEDANEPCGLAVNSRGELFVSEQATGEVVRFLPDAYPLSGTPTYGPREVLDPSGEAKGISVDPFDDRLSVAEGTNVASYGSEAQEFRIKNATGGTYKLSFEGQETVALKFDATNGEVLAALEGLAAFGPGDIAISGTSSAGLWPHRVSFMGARGYEDVPRVEVLPSLIGNETQKLTVKATAGTYKLKFEGRETETAIPFNASAAELKAALEELPNIEPGDVSVTGGPGDENGTSPYFVTFEGTYAATNVGPMARVSSLTGTISNQTVTQGLEVAASSSTSGGIGIDEVQGLSVSGALGGTYKLKFEGQETVALKFDASAAEVQSALVALSNLGSDDVSVFSPSQKTFETRPYSIVFEGARAGTDVPQNETVSALEPGAATATISTEVAGWSGRIGEGVLSEATGVASYTNLNTVLFDGTEQGYRYVSVADSGMLYIFGAQNDLKSLVLRHEVDGSVTPDGSVGFGAAGAYLAADPGNRGAEDKCAAVGEQACTGGHLFLYDAAHGVLDEFDATGEYLDQVENAAFADAEPSAVAVDRSGGAGDGTLYVSAGADAGAKVLAFAPLKPPNRAQLAAPLSHVLANSEAVATDSKGDVYVATGAEIHVFNPAGSELTKFSVASKTSPIEDLAVDSTGILYVVEQKESLGVANYYTPSVYPPTGATTYSHHTPPIVTDEDFPAGKRGITGIAVNPKNDHLIVTSGSYTFELGSVVEGSPFLVKDFASGLNLGNRQEVDVDGRTGNVYFGSNPRKIYAVDPSGKEIVAKMDGGGSPNGDLPTSPYIAVDQKNGHVLAFGNSAGAAREYDAAGAFVAEFGSFTTNITRRQRIAVDSSGGPSDGNVYVAFDDTAPESFDVTTFGPLGYPEVAKRKLAVKRKGTGTGEVKGGSKGEPNTIDCGAICEHEYLGTEVVALVATASGESTFGGWEGCEKTEATSATEGICWVSPDEEKTVAPKFDPPPKPTHLLTVIPKGVGSGTVTSLPEGIECLPKCDADFTDGFTVLLTAKADKGSEVVKWEGCEAEPSATECKVLMSEDIEVEVEFGVEHPLLSVSKEGSGSGTVKGGSGGEPNAINCGATCEDKFNLGDEVSLVAEADPGSVFSGWSGCDVVAEAECKGCDVVAEAECKVTMNEPREVTATFEALPRVSVGQPQPILYREATLRGEVDAEGLPTKFRFEYLSEEEYEENGETFEGAKHSPEEELSGGGKGFAAVDATLLGLEEGTEYRFRLRAQSAAGMAPEEENEGVFQTLERRAPESCPNAEYRIGLSANLPDCRAYELVTPAETNGANVTSQTSPGSTGFDNWLTPPRGAGAGEVLSFLTNVTLPGFEGSGTTDGYRSQRGTGAHPEGGWSTELVSPSYVQAGGNAGGSSPRNGSSDQLYSFWGLTVYYNLEGALPTGIYLRTPAGFEAAGRGSGGDDLAATSQFVSAGGHHVLFSSKAQLEPNAAPVGTEAVYDREAEQASAEVISVEPDGSAFGASEDATYLGAGEDGSAVAFEVGGVLYLHRNGETTQIASSPNTFAGISEDGTRVFYVNAAAQPGGLFVCDAAAGPCAGPGAHAAEAIAASGTFVNVSADGSRVFFTSTEALTPVGEENENHEHAEAGQANLYDWGGAGAGFIAILDPQDLKSFGGLPWINLSTWAETQIAGSGKGFADSPARSTPSGGDFVFQSHAQLSAYDNKGLSEIYRYAPTAEAGERFLCVSCAPSKVPPAHDAVLERIGIAATGVDDKTVVPGLTEDGGAVFFTSVDQLLPEDANDVNDVYEWRAKGSGSCTRSGGCLALISSGQGEDGSFLFSMSADGHDVFVRTTEKLVGQDVAGSPSIYDVRVDGGIPDPPPTAPCQGDACQPAPAPPPTLPEPATTGTGNGNVEAAPARCGKGRHRVKGRCVKSHKRHRRHKRHHRANHRGRVGR